MRITLPDKPELNDHQNDMLNKSIRGHRDKGEASVRTNPEYLNKEWEFGGYIHLIETNRFFIYEVTMVIEKLSWMRAEQRKIIKESTTEVSMDEWLDAFNENKNE